MDASPLVIYAEAGADTLKVGLSKFFRATKPECTLAVRSYTTDPDPGDDVKIVGSEIAVTPRKALTRRFAIIAETTSG